MLQRQSVNFLTMCNSALLVLTQLASECHASQAGCRTGLTFLFTSPVMCTVATLVGDGDPGADLASDLTSSSPDLT